ncbi:protein OCTOPUS-like [Amaranthus tricolor]|uniref:protein OCTOPUS-like n=1 Tax=Amaranthus tricolor TaxID=29722 RepID=UPI0025867376|nr:protein OCTOPUS-like [Amaranthus tricolor]
MNPITAEQLPPPPQPPQPHRLSTSCDRHPDEHFTGFCPSCLCERLAVLDKSSSAAASASTGRKSASSAIKSLFKPNNENTLRGRASSSSFLPELRRTKSFSGGKNEGGFLGFSGVFEPQRKSCDVRGRSTLFSLFSQDDVKRNPVINENEASTSVVIDFKGEEEEFHDNDNGVEIQVLEEENEIVECINDNNTCSNEMISGQKADLKPMKDHIDLDSQNKKVGSKDLKELAGSFWSAASVFRKKLRGAWSRKNKLKKHMNGSHSVQVTVSGKKGNAGRNYRDTQSEIADYGFGRRSCDTDPRFSLDAGRFSVDAGPGRFSIDAARMSFDDVRYSFDEPRASWDGYLVGRTFPRTIPPMVSVVEDAPAPVLAPVPAMAVSRKDGQIPVEEPRRSSVSINGDEPIPGGASQTKDYYSDSSSRRRRSLDRSSSIRKTAAAVVAEMDELKNGGEPKIPPPCVDYLPGSKVVNGDRDFRELDLNFSNSNSLRDDYSERFDLGFRDNASVMSGKFDRKGSSKKSSRWRAWNIWGLIYRRGNSKDDDEDRYSRSISNGVERSYSESWQDLRREGYVDPRGAGFGRNVFRSNSSVSWRNSYGSLGSIRNGAIESNGHGRKKKDEFVLERNRSARYSPKSNHSTDNGMLRFYLTPMRGSRKGGSGKPKPTYPHSFARSVLRFY